MSTEPYSAKSIFFAASEMSDPTERLAYLEVACAGNTALRNRVESLLRAHAQPDAILDHPAAQQMILSEDDRLFDLMIPSTKPGVLGQLGLYDVLEVVGRGGMGIVLRAMDTKLNRVVAIKMLSPVLALSGSSRQRFVREAQSAAAVAHDNIIAIHAVEDSGPVPYLVMQFVNGCTLQQKLDRSGPLPLKEILRISIGIADGLAAAHRNGLVHRDVKPANILLENGIERVKITDFGLARAVDDASLTHSGVIAGTPHYMSPEQANGERVDHRSDLFSLGSVMYALCAGHPPFRATTTMAVLKRVSEDTPRPVREINSEIPEWLAALIVKLHAKDPADRFASASEVANRLTRRLARLQAGDDPNESDSLVREPIAQASESGPRSFPRQRLLAAVGILVAIVGGIAFADWFIPKSTTVPPSTLETAEIAPAPRFVVERPLSLTEQLAKRESPLDGRSREDVPHDLLELVGGGHADSAPKELIAVFAEAGAPVSIAFSPNGQYLASGGYDSQVRLWELAAWKPKADTPDVRIFKGHSQVVWTVAFSPDGRTLASGSFDGTIILWDVATGRNTGALAGHSRSHSLISFSPDGRTIAAGGDHGVIHLWDVATGQRRDLVGFHEKNIRGVTFSPNGRFLASAGNDDTVQIFDAVTGRRLHRFQGTSNRTCVAFCPDGNILAAGCDFPDSSILFWNVQTGEELPSLTGHESHIGDLAYHPLGHLLASGSWDRTARIWNLSNRLSRTLRMGATTDSLQRVAVSWSPEGRYLAAARERNFIAVFRISVPVP